jgi:GxxExxY protein
MHSKRDPVTHEIIGAAIEVHRELGPGILESAYEECLCFELAQRGVSVRRQAALPIRYKGHDIEFGFRPDLIVENQVIVELKSVEKLIKVHDAQLLTYLRLAGMDRGLIINFNSSPLIDGIRRLALTHSAVTAVSASLSTGRGIISPGSESGPE